MDKDTREEIEQTLEKVPPPPKFRYSKLVLKIAAGYVAMVIFTSAAILFSSWNLYSINKTARDIANVDLPVVSALIKLRGSLLAQESFAGKFAILRDRAFIDLFRQRKAEFLANLAVLERQTSATDVAAIKQLYLEYQKGSETLFQGMPVNRGELRASALRLLAALDSYYFKRKDKLHAVLQRADEQQKSTIRWAIGISCLGLLFAVVVARFVTYRLFGSLGKLQKETRRIADGDFNFEPEVPKDGEISELVVDFVRMAERLKELEQTNLDTLPLTRLPGNLAIERVLEERLKSGTPFAFCCANLDNFKAFKAQYGYAKGSELLRVTGFLMHAAVRENGEATDFVGHVGGDEFVMVVSTEKAAAVCEALIKSFDAEVVKHLHPEDHQAGGLERCDLFGVRRFFSITTISIQVIHCSIDTYSSVVDIARAAADVKDCAEKTAESRWQQLPDKPQSR